MFVNFDSSWWRVRVPRPFVKDERVEDGDGFSSSHWEPTPSCRVAAVRAAISPTLSAMSRLEKCFRTNSHLCGVYLLLAFPSALLGDVCGGCLRFCERSDPLSSSNSLVVVFSYLREHELRIERHSSGISPVAHLTVRMSWIRRAAFAVHRLRRQ